MGHYVTSGTWLVSCTPIPLGGAPFHLQFIARLLHGIFRYTHEASSMRPLVNHQQDRQPRQLSPTTRFSMVRRLQHRSFQRLLPSQVPTSIRSQRLLPRSLHRPNSPIQHNVPTRGTSTNRQATMPFRRNTRFHNIRRVPHINLRIKAVAPQATIQTINSISHRHHFTQGLHRCSIRVMMSSCYFQDYRATS